MHDCAMGWFEHVVSLGFDIQSLSSLPFYDAAARDAFAKDFNSLKFSQLGSWPQFDLIIREPREGLAVIQKAVKDGRIDLKLRHRQGLLVTHLAAACGLLNVLKWLVTDKAMSLGTGRAVADVARASSVDRMCEWIAMEEVTRKVSKLTSSHFR